MGESGEGNGDDKIAKFPTKAARFRESAGFYRKGANVRAASEDAPKSEIAPEPLTDEERLEIAQEMNTHLTPIALRHPKWNVTEETIESKVELLLKEAGGNPANLTRYLDAAAHDDVSQDRDILILHLAAARAYLDLLDLHKKEERPDT